MNSKRQTVWLVSMLSLMVVLSAYYLFTDDAGGLETTGGGSEPPGTGIDAVETGDDLPDLEALEDPSDDWAAEWPDEGSAGDVHGHEAGHPDESRDATAGGTASSGLAASGEEQVLERVRKGPQTGEEYIAALEMERMNALSREIEELFNITLDQSRSPEEVARADERLRIIEETQAIVDDLEGQLLQQFENVVITEANGKWNVVVKADKLEKSQVVTIIDMVMDGLNVGADDVVVERVS